MRAVIWFVCSGFLMNSFTLKAQDQAVDFELLNLSVAIECNKPILQTCKTKLDSSAWHCTLESLSQLILENVKYPGLALENGREGTVFNGNENK